MKRWGEDREGGGERREKRNGGVHLPVPLGLTLDLYLPYLLSSNKYVKKNNTKFASSTQFLNG